MLSNPVTYLKGIGPKKAHILRQEAGIETIEDLLYYMPRRYLDRSSFKSIRDCFVNDVVTVSGMIQRVAVAGRTRKFLEVEIDDGTDTLIGVFFGAIPYYRSVFMKGETVIFSGKVNFYRAKQIIHPDFDFIDRESLLPTIHTGRIIPLYRSTESLKLSGFDSRGFRRAIQTALEVAYETITESIEADILHRRSLMPIRDAIRAIHFPESFDEAEQARRRLAFNEVFFHQYGMSLVRRYLRETGAKKRAPMDDSSAASFLSSLPFTLTTDQIAAMQEIRRDIESSCLMNRLLQGDVGSGKTVVAMYAALLVKGQERQTALMAPTELLARQHYETCVGLIGDRARILLLTGSTPRQEKAEIYRQIARGDADIVVGTHALIQEGVAFKRLGLIIIDEQHRFGVAQRSALREKGEDVDLLIMTATPIPRSLSLTLYGDLNVTSLKTMPSERLPVITMSFPESRLPGVYNSIRKYIDQGRQVYYLLPIIDESDKIELKSAIAMYERLRNEVFPDKAVALLHGKMKAEERDRTMSLFKEGKIQILVCTTVIEVGIDVPNANVIVIEHAERFGLAQLHQLRGRVGRGPHQSFCILVSPDGISEESRTRIETIVSTNDGFVIAEEDLKQRGAGELIGFRQHGHAGTFEFADLFLDMDLILYAREIAERKVAELNDVRSIWHEFKERRFAPLLSSIRYKKVIGMIS